MVERAHFLMDRADMLVQLNKEHVRYALSLVITTSSLVITTS